MDAVNLQGVWPNFPKAATESTSAYKKLSMAMSYVTLLDLTMKYEALESLKMSRPAEVIALKCNYVNVIELTMEYHETVIELRMNYAD